MSHFTYGYSHPGLRVAELLRKSPNMTYAHLTQLLGISTYRLRTILKGTKSIDMELALRLSCIFSEHPARDWMDMQTAYDLHQAYSIGTMDAIAREMGAEERNISKADWSMELTKNSRSVQFSLRHPLNLMMDALCKHLDLPPQDVAMEAVKQLWERIDSESC